MPPTVTTQPKNVLTFQSRKATFTVKAKEAKKYQWQVNEGYGWEDIPKATSSKLTVKKVTVDMFGNQYRCVVTNADGETFSDAATLMVMPKTAYTHLSPQETPAGCKGYTLFTSAVVS